MSDMASVYERHRIMHQLVMRLGERAWVRCRNPVALRPASELQPDLLSGS
jgi:hypothetical protein